MSQIYLRVLGGNTCSRPARSYTALALLYGAVMDVPVDVCARHSGRARGVTCSRKDLEPGSCFQLANSSKYHSEMMDNSVEAVSTHTLRAT